MENYPSIKYKMSPEKNSFTGETGKALFDRHKNNTAILVQFLDSFSFQNVPLLYLKKKKKNLRPPPIVECSAKNASFFTCSLRRNSKFLKIVLF